MVHFTQCGFRTLFYSDIRMAESPPPGCPIREPRDQGTLAPPPGLSRPAAPFFAGRPQGIRHGPALAWPYHLFRSFTNNRDFRVCTFSNQAVHSPSLKSFFYFQHTAEDIPVCFRPSFVISKNSVFQSLGFFTLVCFWHTRERNN